MEYIERLSVQKERRAEGTAREELTIVGFKSVGMTAEHRHGDDRCNVILSVC